MNNMIELAKQQVKETVMNALGRLVAEGKIEAVPLPAFNVERPADVSHGDFSCNAAMASAKALRNNPRAIGQMIADAAVLDGTVFEKIEVAGPGFLNFFISPLWFNETVGEVISSGSDYGKTELGKGKRVLVEFVSANPTGPMHIGNARGGALGDSLSSVLQFAGYEVEREFYVNDAGNQIEKFGKSLSIRYMQIADGNKSLQDVYTQREQEEFVRMNDEFSSKIVKLNDNLYYYNGYYLPVNQFDSSVFFTRYGIDKLTTLDSVRNKHIIDAGGYVGDTALLFSSYTDKNIHVFEASPSNMDIIRETIRLNHLDNIVPVSKALGEKSGTATFSLGERNSCNSLVERPGYNYPDHIEVPVVTLDDYVRENNIEVGLIKVDIEGGEQLLLRGAVETIRTQHPILLISIYHSANDFFEIKPMIEKMCDKYTFRIVKPANPAIALETILLAEVRDESGENIINS